MSTIKQKRNRLAEKIFNKLKQHTASDVGLYIDGHVVTVVRDDAFIAFLAKTERKGLTICDASTVNALTAIGAEAIAAKSVVDCLLKVDSLGLHLPLEEASETVFDRVRAAA